MMTWRIAVARVTIRQPETMKAAFIDEGVHAQGLDTDAVWNSVLHRSHYGNDRRACDGSYGLTGSEASLDHASKRAELAMDPIQPKLALL